MLLLSSLNEFCIYGGRLRLPHSCCCYSLPPCLFWKWRRIDAHFFLRRRILRVDVIEYVDASSQPECQHVSSRTMGETTLETIRTILKLVLWKHTHNYSCTFTVLSHKRTWMTTDGLRLIYTIEPYTTKCDWFNTLKLDLVNVCACTKYDVTGLFGCCCSKMHHTKSWSETGC